MKSKAKTKQSKYYSKNNGFEEFTGHRRYNLFTPQGNFLLSTQDKNLVRKLVKHLNRTVK